MSAEILPYRLLDSGDGRKLEDVGPFRVERQASVALWKPRLPREEWKKAVAVHQRSDTGGGFWDFKRKLPESWITEIGGLRMKTKATSFGHLGYFAEQASEWEWLRQSAALHVKAGVPPKLLNLFGYTGGSTLALAQAGAHVTHVDAAKGVVDWGRENQALNEIPGDRIRWIVDDCLVFLKREERRGNKYDGVLLDPPSYGRGPKKEVFKIEDNLGELLAQIARVLVPQPVLLHLSCHSPGFTPIVLKRLWEDHLSLDGLPVEGGEMVVPEADQARFLPSGSYCRLSRPPG